VDSGRASTETETGTLSLESGARDAHTGRQMAVGWGSRDPVALRHRAGRLRVGELPPRLTEPQT